MRLTTFGGGGVRNYTRISGFEGSQAVPACPSGTRNAYDAGRTAFIVKFELTLGGGGAVEFWVQLSKYFLGLPKPLVQWVPGVLFPRRKASGA
jgi:hypothetical protein